MNRVCNLTPYVIDNTPGKKSQLSKKTSVSINGQLLPMAQLSSNDKDIHLTVQKANPSGQQLQPTVQEISLAGQNNGMLPNSGGQVGLHPGMQTIQHGINTMGKSYGYISCYAMNRFSFSHLALINI